MKWVALTIAFVAFLGLMVYTNPTMDEYDNFLRQNYMKEIQGQNPDTFSRLFGSLVGNIASGVISTQTVRKDFVFFSTYEAQLNKEKLRVVGLFRNFVVLEGPGLK